MGRKKKTQGPKVAAVASSTREKTEVTQEGPDSSQATRFRLVNDMVGVPPLNLESILEINEEQEVRSAEEEAWQTVTRNRPAAAVDAIQGRLLTKDRMRRMGYGLDFFCDLCGMADEDHEHLFFNCTYSQQCMRLLEGWLGGRFPDQLIPWCCTVKMKKLLQLQIRRCAVVAITYLIWQQRNQAHHRLAVLRPKMLIQQLMHTMKIRCRRIYQGVLSSDNRNWLSAKGLM